MQPEPIQSALGDQAGLLWTWWKGDPLPPLPSLPDFTFQEAHNIEVLASLMERSQTEVIKLLQEKHRPYLAYLEGVPVAFGWSATGHTGFGGGRVLFQVPALNRYLYDFVTLPAWRGRGIYPRLLQYILNRESDENERFWIVHQSSNTASEQGIRKAGFYIASKVYFLHTDELGLVPSFEHIERAHAGAVLLGLPLIDNLGEI